MRDSWFRHLAQILTACAVGMLLVSAVMLFLTPNVSNLNWLGNLAGDLVALGAPILGLLIITRQPRNRIGWLWIFYGLLVGLRSLGHSIYYFSGSQPTGYSALEYFLLWSTELTNISIFACLILLLLWFPDGQLPSLRWHFLYLWLLLAWGVLFLSLFEPGPNWNGGADAGGIVVDNPYGWLPENTTHYLGLPAFLSILLIMVLAAVSLISRYRSAGEAVRLQLRWFVMGSFVFVILFVLPVFTGSGEIEIGLDYLFIILGQAAIVPLYLAIGIAILRYRLFDIDFIIRKTIQYTLLTGLLALVYFGSVVMLQNLAENLFGEQSPLVIVLSTLFIAALFNPLRSRIQDFIDRQFFRQKYNAEQALAQFATTARDEVEIDKLTVALLSVVKETMQPERISLWIKQ